MKIAELAIQRPVFITCLVLLMLAVGGLSLLRLPVDQYPSVEFPWVAVTVVYPGAGPEEIANLVSKPIEEEVRTISGMKQVQSWNSEGVASIFVEFNLDAELGFAEQQVRNRVALARTRMPKEIEEPLITRYNPTDQPVSIIALRGDRPIGEMFEIADRKLRPRFEQVPKVSQVKIFGGSKREIQVQLDRDKLAAHQLSVSQIGQALEMGGTNIPLGKRPDADNPGRETIYRSLGEYNALTDVRNAIVKFLGNDVPVRLGDLGTVRDTYKEETSKAFLNGQPTLVMEISRQSGANTVAVAEGVKKRMDELNTMLAEQYPGLALVQVRDGARAIRANITDVGESIGIGIILTVVVVFLFLGTLRSTLITGVALPNSLLGAFVLVAAAGFSVNMLTLLALSLAVGLLIDDAIVVRENIFRHMELGQPPREAALVGTKEVGLAVIATTLAILSVFGPIAFVGGITGRFLREFGLTVCFVMLISLFDALTMGPMLSAHFAGKKSRKGLFGFFSRFTDPVVRAFDRFQTWLEDSYERVSRWTLGRPGLVLVSAVVILGASLFLVPGIPKTFLPTPDTGELLVQFELEPGSTLQATQAVTLQLEEKIRSNPAVELTSAIAGNNEGNVNQGSVYVRLKPANQRHLNSTAYKNQLRAMLKSFEQYRVKVVEYDPLFGGFRPFAMKLMSNDPEALRTSARRILARMKQYPGFVEADLDQREGKPEVRVVYDDRKTKLLGVSSKMAGAELRAQIEGITPAKFRERGEEWDIRVRLRDQDRELRSAFPEILVPNMNGRLVSLAQVAALSPTTGPTTIVVQDGLRTNTISADMAKNVGIGDLMEWLTWTVKQEKLLPESVQMKFEGQGEQFEEMAQNMGLAVFMAILFIYLVLASLYESFTTPFLLLLALPLAVCGALAALWLGGQSLNLFSIIATIMLLGIATKNSILLVDYTNQLVAKGRGLKEALVEAGKTRLRPILMTSMALVAGTLPVAIGLNEASKQRTSMGYVIIGGVISSTLLTLVVVPAAVWLFRRRKAKPDA